MLGLVHRPIFLVALCAAIYPRRSRQQTLCLWGGYGLAYIIGSLCHSSTTLVKPIPTGRDRQRILKRASSNGFSAAINARKPTRLFRHRGHAQRTGGGLINGSLLPTVQQSCSRPPARLLLPLLQRSPRLSTRAGIFSQGAPCAASTHALAVC